MKSRRYHLVSNGATLMAVLALVGMIWSLKSDANSASSAVVGTASDGNLRTSAPGVSPLADEYYPPGPYVTFAASSEMITLPEPPTPNLVQLNSLSARTACPWDAEGLFDWHEASTWGDDGVPAAANGDVTLPAGARVVLKQSPGLTLGVVHIPHNSELILQEVVDGNLELDVMGITVHGALTLGSPTCLIQSPVTIRLHGSRPDDAVTNPPPPHVKGIHVTSSGSLAIHGKRYFHTWTRLARTVDPRAEVDAQNILMLQQEVNWEAGQQVVVVTSALKDDRAWHQNEIRTIQGVHPNPPEGVGAVVYLTEPLYHRHVANRHYQTEVALLSRVVVIEGSADDSEPTDPDPLNCIWDYDEKYGSDAIAMQCPETELTGYGGHIMVQGRAQVQGVELYRMGQTNVKARYPMHFHMLGNTCEDCYFAHSSVHRSYYRCVTIHGTNSTTVTENVAYDAIGYCYYLEDGVEMENTISHNLAAHIHWLGPKPAHGRGQKTGTDYQSDILTLPADVTASGFYITNAYNYIIGNAASGGWSGFHFPNLKHALESFRDLPFSPAMVPTLVIDGNTAHSTAFWWIDAGAFYIGGGISYDSDGKMEYQAGRGAGRGPCKDFTDDSCGSWEREWSKITNSKVFLSAGVGLNSWSGRFDIDGFEAHDTGMIIQALANGFWMNRLLQSCRTGEPLALPPGFRPAKWDASFLRWYDTGQAHILSNSIIRNCGVRSLDDVEFDEYNQSPERGCPFDDSNLGCDNDSSVWSFNSHSDKFVPEIMQATTNITYENCGRRFRFIQGDLDSASARQQNWLDADGSASGLGEPTLIGSGIASVTSWWNVDDDDIFDPQGPVWFIKKNDGPKRNLAHVRITWDEALFDQVGDSVCNDDPEECPALGYLRHLGQRFEPDQNDPTTWGMPVTANSEMVGPTGGFGWFLNLDRGAPKTLTFGRLEVDPESVLLISIPYPPGTTFTVTASSRGCTDSDEVTCSTTFEQTEDLEEVRTLGNTYHVHSSGVLTVRVSQIADEFVGLPDWLIPGWDELHEDSNNGYALDRFERAGVRLPLFTNVPNIQIVADCAGGLYCSGDVESSYNPDVCPSGYAQIGYDRCCQGGNTNNCVYPGETTYTGV